MHAFYAVSTRSSVVLLTRFEQLIFHVPSDVVGIQLAVQEAVLGLAQGAGGDVSSAADVRDNSSPVNANPFPKPPFQLLSQRGRIT